jgi:hypothetical protein
MRYRLRTLLILLAVGPPALAWLWPTVESAYYRWKHAGSTRVIVGGRLDAYTPVTEYCPVILIPVEPDEAEPSN